MTTMVLKHEPPVTRLSAAEDDSVVSGRRF